MAQVMGGNGAMASEIVAVSTVCSVVTIFLFVYVLSVMGML
jgi:predicted permease